MKYRDFKNLYYVRYCTAWYLVGRAALTLILKSKLSKRNLCLLVYHRLGECPHEIARLECIPERAVRRRLKAIKVKPHGRKREYATPGLTLQGNYLAAQTRAKRYCHVHRACWEAYYGPIYRGFHVHHVDGDHFNNDISNLAALASGIHRQVHFSKFGPWRYERQP